jgi:PHD/YefM family antitoxin component YafN of YafNO toxin-antitoxin module
MRTDTRDLVSITEASRSLSRMTDAVLGGRTLVVLRNNEPAAALVSMAKMDELDRLEERESDLRLLALALARELADSGVRHDLEDVIAELGIDLDRDA